jgi:hypothetical protein
MHLFAMEARAEKMDRDQTVKVWIDDAVSGILAWEYVVKKFTKEAKVSDREIKKYYNEHKSEFLKPATVKAREHHCGS